jgi:hypothetical protein
MFENKPSKHPFAMSKIYCRIYNGIGNQLFGYALGLYLSKKHNKELFIDLAKLNQINFLSKIGLKKDTIRKYELEKLGFIHPFKKFSISGFFIKFKFLISRKYLVVDFRNSHFELGQIPQNKDIFLIGWGNFNVVKDIIPEMRKRFKPNFEISPSISYDKKVIVENNSVAVHFRRTDFLDARIGKIFNGICNESYYKNAIRQIKGVVENPFFIIFTDDIDYVRENMKIDNSYVVDGNAGYIDLYLMSLCKHFILANSTFGFWAAMLNNSENKLVCVPEYWYNNPLRMAEYIPEEWFKIKI